MNELSTEPTVQPVTRPHIEAAAARVRDHLRVTPVMDLEPGAFGVPGRLTLKLELFQHTGSFKPRGAFNLLLSRHIPPAGVVAASGGNFGLAVAYAAKKLGRKATIFVPEVSPEAKRSKIRSFGAEVAVAGPMYSDALEASHRAAESTGALFAHAYDQPEVVAGQGTCARELEAQSPHLDSVIVAVGGGGLIAGFAGWYEKRVRVISVEPERATTMVSALKAGRPVDVDVSGIAADSLGARRLGAYPFAAASRWIDTAVLVSDEAIIEAQRLLWDKVKVLCEPGSAAPLAALLSGAYVPEPGERVGLVVCGGNTDPARWGSSPAA